MEGCCGYGIPINKASNHYIGIAFIEDNARIEKKLDEMCLEYQIAKIGDTGIRGLICRMLIENNSIHYLKKSDPFDDFAQRNKIFLEPYLINVPLVRLLLKYSQENKDWKSILLNGVIQNGSIPKIQH